MTEVSVTVTVGEGSEAHNHDLEYRSTLKHVHDREDGVIELIPYRDYSEVIEEAMKPYIDRYNQRVEERYQAAWERYNAGEIKTKPRKRDYQKMSDCYMYESYGEKYRNPHTGKVEEAPMFRSIIVGIGDREDRQSGRVTEGQAKAIFRDVVAKFQETFPAFLLLGATLHLDEQGFYHAHIDYKPMYEKSEPDTGKGQKRRGLDVGTGQEAALEHMGFKPEQSIINGRDKAPLLFNAFRNEIYRMMEASMAEHGLRLQYGVSARKEPEKDSSRNQKLDAWQATQDAARDLQHKKNVALDIVSQDKVSPEGFKAAMAAVEDLNTTLQKVQESPQTVMRNGYKVTFTLFDQLKSMVESLKENIGHLLRKLDQAMSDLELYKPFKEKFEQIKDKHDEMERELLPLRQEVAALKKEKSALQEQVYLRDTFLEQGDYAGKNMMAAVLELEEAEEKRKKERPSLSYKDPSIESWFVQREAVVRETNVRIAAVVRMGGDEKYLRDWLKEQTKKGMIPVIYYDMKEKVVKCRGLESLQSAIELTRETKGSIKILPEDRGFVKPKPIVYRQEQDKVKNIDRSTQPKQMER